METPDRDPDPSQSGEEQFETFSESGAPLGLAPRSIVHASGIWHRSVHVFLFDAAGRLHLQRRAADKDVCPGLWDQSAAEHLKPGETFADGARRGLTEELGVTGVVLTMLGEPFAARLDLPEVGIRDYEMQQSFRGVWSGTLTPDPAEVAEVRAVSLGSLDRWLAKSPGDFTPWFLRDVYRCGILPRP